jgi:hypothetical protein
MFEAPCLAISRLCGGDVQQQCLSHASLQDSPNTVDVQQLIQGRDSRPLGIVYLFVARESVAITTHRAQAPE